LNVRPAPPPLVDVLRRFARLGLTAFGGPVAHLGYFRREFVERAGWLDDAAFAEIVALCSVLPGPTSSQVGLLLGWRRAGFLGSLVAWFAFTTPSAIALAVAGIALRAHGENVPAGHDALGAAAARGALAGLAGAAAAVVTLAVVTLARSLAATPRRAALACLAFAVALAGSLAGVPGAAVLALALGAVAGGGVLVREAARLPAALPPLRLSRRSGVAAAGTLAGLLALSAFVPRGGYLGLAAIFLRAGSLVFGGGHVVLPFLEGAIGPGLVPSRTFLAGYGAAQSVPGPLFTFAAFIGAVNRSPASGVAGAVVATVAIFLPSFLLVAAALPLWARLRDFPRAPAVLAGANAAVVGLLATVLVTPIAPALARSPVAALVTVPAFALLTLRRVPAWAIALGGAASGAAIAAFVPSLN